MPYPSCFFLKPLEKITKYNHKPFPQFLRRQLFVFSCNYCAICHAFVMITVGDRSNPEQPPTASCLWRALGTPPILSAAQKYNHCVQLNAESLLIG